jgi:hypothetical protein
MTNRHNDKNTQYISEEHEADMLSQLSDKGSEHNYRETVSELEKYILLAFKEQEGLLSAYSPNFVHPQHLSSKLAQPKIG